MTSIRKFTVHVSWLMMFGCLTFSLLSKIGIHHWLLEIWSHFHWQYFFTTLVATLLIALAGRVRHLLVAVVLLSYQGWQLVPWFEPANIVQHEQGERLKVLQYNVLYINQHKQATIDWVLSDEFGRYDVVALIETSEEWLPALAPMDKHYPNRVDVNFDGPFGMTVFSRLPITSKEVIRVGSAGLPTIRMELQTSVHQIPVVFYVTHPYPPISQRLAKLRNNQLDTLSRRVGADPATHKIYIGDFNLTPFSPWFARVEELTGMYEAQHGRGPANSWPTEGLLSALGGIYIDLAFLTPNIAVSQRAFGDLTYADHRAVYSEFWINKPKGN